ncbi:BTAD domain-containing putative transcriptional regulator [Arthrobacter sp. Marseille-P9274]|uniref:AfsR/SARP family transcriptional regulator n=1 Tax=Arthrobacter sp. Marseille-P9274 TaxID=2866572 RepID=UPI0021C92465|nr:BTAD domain-containing putative transcriptional regulator [Arthrobacter sp. Marseille-P9274]
MKQLTAGYAEPISVRMIGNLEVRRGDAVMTSATLGSPKVRQVFGILLLRLGARVSKSELIELLWDGRPPLKAQATLESYVSVLRRSLQPGVAKTGPLRTATGSYLLDPDLVDVDLICFNDLVAQAEGLVPEEAYPLLVQALKLGSAPLLSEELDTGWAEEARAQHSSMVTSVQIRAAETAEQLGRTQEAIDWAGQAVTSAPLNDRAWCTLVLALESADRYVEALQSYDKCRRLLDRELGCAPAPDLRAAHLRLLQKSAQDDDELYDVLDALFYLNDRLRGQSRHPGLHASGKRPQGSASRTTTARRVIHSFLNKALTVA